MRVATFVNICLATFYGAVSALCGLYITVTPVPYIIINLPLIIATVFITNHYFGNQTIKFK